MGPVHQPPLGPPPGRPPVGVHGVLSVLEEMAAAAGQGGSSSSQVPDHFAWLPMGVVPALGTATPDRPGSVPIDPDLAARFGAVDAIRPQTRSLRVGLGFLTGATDAEGPLGKWFEPLVTVPVVVVGNALRRAGDVELTPLVGDRHVRARLEEDVDWGVGVLEGLGEDVPADRMPAAEGVLAHLRRVVDAIGYDPPAVIAPVGRPSTLRDSVGLRLVLGAGLFALGSRPEFSPAAALAEWHTTVGTRWTALHSLYLDHPPPAGPSPGPDLSSAYRLSEAQHEAVVASRTEPVTVIAGAPGTGKTHTIAAIVGDAVAHGRSVLVAAKADATVEAISELLDRRPGPDPLVFGSSDRRWALARRLAAGEPQAVPSAEVLQRHAAMQQARRHRDATWLDAADALAGMTLLGDGPEARQLRQRLPGVATADLFTVESLLERTGRAQPPWWRPGARRAWSSLTTSLGVASPTEEELAAVARLAAAVRRLHASPDPLLDGIDWSELAAAQHDVEERTGEWMDAMARSEQRLGKAARGTLGVLALALRAGRAKRRAQLATLVGQQVTVPLPVWLGTLADIDDLLPLEPAMFDLVVLDEASSIDQPRAAAALLRGARAVVVGDPQQLRHVSFVAGEAVKEAIRVHAPGASAALQAKLDVRDSSIFDVAAASAPVRTLDEHFRSAPHLFAWVGRELYRGEVTVATRTPLTDRQDRIEVVRVEGARNDRKVVEAEVVWVIDRLRQLWRDGATSVGVISPFRAQADALEDAALTILKRRGIDELGLRVGTVHAFQGMERDVVLASLGVGADDGPRTWRFVDDPNLFAVFATRARERMEVVLSAAPPSGSLVADYLDQVDHPPPPPSGIGSVDRWTATVAEGLLDAGVEVAAPYPVGRHAVDLVLHEGTRYLGVVTRLHPDGPHLHVRRQLELTANGWPIRTAHRAIWGDRLGELVVALAGALRHG
ncbi:DEAD/DEAH box helicase [Euzebya rosea]|uniref:DEAD/DEAH box helicase n=1 Tax=Euzebya rosea TaxID=2052804 RepID=UPI00130042FA|nr:ATP-binding protein [Euzebya rosea]